ncbi:sulfotransferase domain-containing protein [Euzebya tangerina]|uniref:sulfotransferase domain-containing protein n=1 Tax=Euzebya tangerina TaxID=591198 RepID=UPI000E319859|nr:sulfotransferase domain-containing protein [Euzebya tangerina]
MHRDRDSLYPNLVIAGAARCGTTSLYEYLALHPAVCPAQPKETRFLFDRDHSLARQAANVSVHGMAGYRQFFPEYRADRHRVVMDATPDYMYQHTPLQVLERLEDVKVVFSLRRPSDRVYSMYNYARNRQGALDRRVSFAEFVERLQGREIPGSMTILAGTLDHSRYVTYLSSWYDRLGRDRIHTVLFEDLVESPIAVVAGIARHVGIDPAFYDNHSLRAHNTSRAPRVAAGDTALRSVLPSLRRLPGYRTMARPVKRLYDRWQFSSKEVLDPSDRSVLREIDDQFAADNRELAALTGLDLSGWAPHVAGSRSG